MVSICRRSAGAVIEFAVGATTIAMLIAALVASDTASAIATTAQLPSPSGSTPIRAIPDSGLPTVNEAAPWTLSDPVSTLTSAAATSPASWSSVETLPATPGTVEGISVGAREILYRAGTAHYVLDRDTNTRSRIDTFFDGTPLPDDVLQAAISGDGETVALLRKPPNNGRIPLLRLIRRDLRQNIEFPVPDPGSVELVDGGSRLCSVMTGLRRLQVSDGGDTVWFETHPCTFYPRLLAIDVRNTTPHWRWLQLLGDDPATTVVQQVTADGRSFLVGGRFFDDLNDNWRVDPGEPRWAEVFDPFPIEFNDRDALIGNYILNWPPNTTLYGCKLPRNSYVHTDASGRRMLVSTDEVGHDPDTVVYEPGQQLYWIEDGQCRLRSLGRTDADDLSEFRLSTDGRSSLAYSSAGGVVRRELATGASLPFTDVDVSMADPLLTQAARVSSSTLQVAQLKAQSAPLKVAILGDSYISGEGTSRYEPGTDKHGDDSVKNLCHRSVESWAYRIGLRLANYRTDLVRSFACSGATTRNMEAGQYTERDGQLIPLKLWGAAKPVDVVFMSAGGNDAGFRDMIVDCLALACLRDGWKRERLKGVRRAAKNVERILLATKAMAPNATVFLTGYPSIVNPPGADCQELGLTYAQRRVLRLNRYTAALELASGGLRLDKREQEFFNDVLIPALNADLAKAAGEAGVHYINPTTWFANNGICTHRYASGLTPGDDFPEVAPFMGNESFHPTVFGHREMEERIERGFGDSFRANANPPQVPQDLVSPEGPDTIGFLKVNGQIQAWGNNGNVTIQGLPSGTKVVLALYSTPTLLGSGTVGADGTVSIPYSVPVGLHPGLHAIVAYDEETAEPIGTTLTSIDPPTECLTGDGDVDLDEDALADRCDASLEDGPRADADGDGVLNLEDDCPVAADSGQEDSDGDGSGDACDPDEGHSPVAELEPFPQVTIPRPAPKVRAVTGPPARTKEKSAAFSFEATDHDGQAGGAMTTSCTLDGGQAVPCTSPHQVSELSEGAHRLSVTATDSYGVKSEPLLFEWTLDNIAPKVDVWSSDAPETSSNRGWVYFWGSDSGDYRAKLSYRCALDGAPPTACTSPAEFDDLALGEHRVTVVATDEAGNESAEETASWSVVPPSIVYQPPTTPDFPIPPEVEPVSLIEGSPRKAGVLADGKGRFTASDLVISCGGDPCSVAVTATVPSLPGQKPKPKKPVKIASTQFTMDSGDTSWIQLRLTSKARSALKRSKRLKPTLAIVVRTAGEPTLTRKVRMVVRAKP